jgi:hypothetical protein
MRKHCHRRNRQHHTQDLHLAAVSHLALPVLAVNENVCCNSI